MIILLIGVLLIIGSICFYIFNKGDDSKLKSKMEVASKDYFEKYVSLAESASAYNVTLNMLEEANNNGETYDLNGLEKCDKEKTYASVTIDYKTGKPKNVEVKLNC